MDEHYLERLKSGDPKALEEIYHSYNKTVLSTAYYVLNGDLATAKDIRQEVFIELWHDRATLDIKVSLGGYLVIVTKRKAIDLQRKQGRRSKHEKIKGDSMPTTEAPCDKIEKKELNKIIRAAVRKIPSEIHRKAFELVCIHGFKNTEAADELGISAAAVGVYVKRAKKFLKKILKKTLLNLLWLLF